MVTNGETLEWSKLDKSEGSCNKKGGTQTELSKFVLSVSNININIHILKDN